MAAVLIAVALASILATEAFAAWSTAGSGSAAGAAASMPAGNTPKASASGTNVTVNWSQATLSSGAALEGYVMERQNASTKAVASVEAECSGIVTTLTCTEHNVPPGTWIYTDTPVEQKWKGAASSPSNSVTVE